MNLRRLALNAISMAGGGVVAQLCLIAVEAVIARRLGQESYGVYSTVFAISIAAAVVADLGMSWKLIEDGSRNRASIPAVLGTTLTLKLVLFALVFPLAWALLVLAGYPAEVVLFFAAFFPYAALVIVQETFASVYAAHQRMHVSALFQAASAVGVLIAVLAATRASPSLPTLAGAFVAAGGAVTLAWGWRVFREERPRVRLQDGAALLRGSYLYGIGAALAHVMARVDVILLSLLRNLAEAGLFAAADKLAELGAKVGIVVSRVLLPALFAQSHEDVALYRRSCKIVLRGASACGVFGCLALAFLAEPLLVAAFGRPFGAAAFALVLLAVALSLRLIGMALQLILMASGENARRTGSLAIALAVAVGGNLVLTPAYGIVGAALARIAADGAQVAMMLGARNIPVHRADAARWILGPVALGAGSYSLAVFAGMLPTVRCAAGLAIYAGSLVATRMIDLGELRALARIGRGAAKA